MDTIFASANQNVSAIKIIRVSGSEAKNIPDIFNFSRPKPRKHVVRKLIYKNRLIDIAVVFWLPGPKTVTGEDIFELHVHGSMIIEDLIYKAMLNQKNFRLAEKGEFTKRGFLNGIIDLSQVEAINDIINAETEKQLELANLHAEGNLKKKIEDWRKQLVNLIMKTELIIDFSDEDIPKNIEKMFVDKLDLLITELDSTIKNSNFFQTIRNGFTVSIIGKPNVGKSSLMNHIANKKISIVTKYAGTTRDVLEHKINLNGYPIYLNDTAGIRKTKSKIEKEGVKKAKEMINKSDIVLNLSADGDFEIPIKRKKSKIINIRTKSDINTKKFKNEDLSISIKKKIQIDKLLKRIFNVIQETEPKESSFLINKRQESCAKSALLALKRIKKVSLFNSAELVAEELRLAAAALSSVTTIIDIDEIFDEIFLNFCIGK